MADEQKIMPLPDGYAPGYAVWHNCQIESGSRLADNYVLDYATWHGCGVRYIVVPVRQSNVPLIMPHACGMIVGYGI